MQPLGILIALRERHELTRRSATNVQKEKCISRFSKRAGNTSGRNYFRRHFFFSRVWMENSKFFLTSIGTMGRVVKRSGIVRKYIRNIKIGRINWCALFFARIIFPRHINIFIALASSKYESCLHRNSTNIRGVIQGVYESGYTSASAMRASADTHIGRLRETRAGSSSEMRVIYQASH